MIRANFSQMPAQAARHRRISYSPIRRGFTLVEMLVAISITLVMMATVVGVFATVSSSVSNRRAAIEVGSQLRHVRNVLQRDLEGATCPTLPWTRPESNVGYFEIVEGLHCDFYPSDLTDLSIAGTATSIQAPGGKIDHATSTLPSSNLPMQAGWVTDGGGLGDYDDILAFTSRNEKEPFTGPAPLSNVETNNNNRQAGFANWQSQTISSPVAEVVWFCVENPATDTQGYFGNESLAGFRTIYRRTLLVAPWLDYRYNIDGQPKSRPGVLRVLSLNEPDPTQFQHEAEALAALIAFQERFDISARIEYDPTIDAGRWTIVANTLADLTNRKNRYEHHGFVVDANNSARRFPYVLASAGGANGGNDVSLFNDPDLYGTDPTDADVDAGKEGNAVFAFAVNNFGNGYISRPLAVLEGGATARVIINEDGNLIHATTGPVPLGAGQIVAQNSNIRFDNRRGQDLMMSDALAFDIQVYDPEAPVYAIRADGTVVTNNMLGSMNATQQAQLDATAVGPADVGWAVAAVTNDHAEVSEGAYVDLGFSELHREVVRRLTGSPPSANFPASQFSGLAHGKSLLNDARLTRVYDTWNFAYENDGMNQDQDEILPNGNYAKIQNNTPQGRPMVDEGTDGFDSFGEYQDATGVTRLGPDDHGERETSPPYPVPLRAVQIKLRVYEPDSRQMREVTVRQHFVPE